VSRKGGEQMINEKKIVDEFHGMEAQIVNMLPNPTAEVVANIIEETEKKLVEEVRNAQRINVSRDFEGKRFITLAKDNDVIKWFVKGDTIKVNGKNIAIEDFIKMIELLKEANNGN
jgi:RNase P/RNase MRP subunit p29